MPSVLNIGDTSEKRETHKGPCFSGADVSWDGSRMAYQLGRMVHPQPWLIGIKFELLMFSLKDVTYMQSYNNICEKHWFIKYKR